MNFKTQAILYALMVSQAAFALVEAPINERKPVEVEFSSSTMNRICIDGGTVEKVIADHSYVDINIDEFTGQVFVSLYGDLPQEGTTMSIISSSGAIQDVFATSAHKPSELLVLKEKDWIEEAAELASLSLGSNSIDFLNDVIGGVLPHGYGHASNDSVPTLKLPKGLEATLERVIEGPFERVATYRLKNTSRKEISLSPEAFNAGERGWAFLADRHIKPKESIVCILSYKKGEAE